MNKHQNVHVLFSLSLFLLFVIGSFFIVTYEIRGYQSIHETCTQEDELAIPLAYLNTKLKANDYNQSTSIVTINDTKCLLIRSHETVTYIYLQDGYLKELYGRDDFIVRLEDGDKLFELDDFIIKQEGHLFSFQVIKNNDKKSLSVFLHG